VTIRRSIERLINYFKPLMFFEANYAHGVKDKSKIILIYIRVYESFEKG